MPSSYKVLVTSPSTKNDNAVFETMIRYIEHVKTFFILGAETKLDFVDSHYLDL